MGAERPPRTWGPSVICRTDVVQERKEPLPFIKRGSRGVNRTGASSSMKTAAELLFRGGFVL